MDLELVDVWVEKEAAGRLLIPAVSIAAMNAVD